MKKEVKRERWTEESLKNLVKMANKDMTRLEIANEMNCTKERITYAICKLRRLGLKIRVKRLPHSSLFKKLAESLLKV